MNSEVRRIINIPIFEESPPPDFVESYRLPGSTEDLLPSQKQALFEAEYAGGLIAVMGVGHGKSLVCLLLSQAFGIPEDEPTLLLLPRRTYEGFVAEAVKWWPHFKISPNLHVMTYGMFSHYTSSTFLRDLQPRAIIADECHKLANRSATRTSRLIRYIKKNPDTKLAFLSGTIMNREIEDFLHLVEMALREEGCFLPLRWTDLKSWGRCLNDSFDWPRHRDWEKLQPLVEEYIGHKEGSQLLSYPVKKRHALCRQALNRRMAKTPGVVVTVSSSCEASIYLRRMTHPIVPKNVLEAVQYAEKWWELPQGHELTNAAHVATASSTLLQGFYYYYVWPDGEPDIEWLDARREWDGRVSQLVDYRIPGHDSAKLIKDLICSGQGEKIATTKARTRDVRLAEQAWDWWKTQRHKPEPEQRVKWLSDFMIDYVAEWRQNNPRSLVWTTHTAMAKRLAAEIPDLHEFDPNRKLDGKRSLRLSSSSHSEGLNLQAWTRFLVICPSSSGRLWEQLIGRVHRNGQMADEIFGDVVQHHQKFIDKFDRAVKHSKALQDVTSQPQKLQLANIYFTEGSDL